jgi:hypothetical protein
MTSSLQRLGAAALLSGAAACVDSTAQQNTAQAIIDMGNELSAVRQDAAVLQEQVDSLRGALARQDTVLRQLAGMAGLPVPPR